MKVIFFANTDWYLYNFRLGFAKFLRERSFEVVMISPPGTYGALLEQAGFRWIVLHMDRRSIHPWRELAVLRQIIAVYAAEKPDIVHHFTIKSVIYGSLAAAWHRVRNRINAIEGMGYVYTSRDLLARVLRPLVQALMAFAAATAQSRLILHNTEDLEMLWRGRTKSLDNVRIIMGAGIDTKVFRPGPPRAVGGRTRVLFASRLLRDKGILEYIAAARALKESGSDIEFILAGSPDPGNPTSVSPDDVDRWRAYVTYLGHADDMPRLLETMDIVVLPSYREGAPRILIEAAAAGVAVIATDVAGCREVVEHQTTGLLIPVRNVPSLVDAIRFLHERPDERLRMGREGRRKALEEFEESIVFEKTFAVYQELLPKSVSV